MDVGKIVTRKQGNLEEGLSPLELTERELNSCSLLCDKGRAVPGETLLFLMHNAKDSSVDK